MNQFCQQCGAENLPEAKFCKQCGNDLIKQSELTPMIDSEKKLKWSPWLLAFFPVIWMITELVFTHQGIIIAETVAEAFGAAIALTILPFLITFIIFIKKKAQGFAYVNFVKDTVMAMIAMSILHVFIIINDRHMETNSLPQSENIEATTTNDAASSEEISSSPKGIDSEVGIMYPLDIFTVNIRSESGKRYIKLEANLELQDDKAAQELDFNKALIRDIIIRILSSKTLENISTIEGKEKLKEDITNELNMRLKHGKIKNIYFTDFVIE